ncbi:hypothetical protein ACHAWU_001241 [Discostella pseudostelligera]|uniref:RanBP2-type domain-containing protein n=1 Tax=Discostella pseudostelligera TaxID=259834 RepID=A0ABD3MZ46_9STRA
MAMPTNNNNMNGGIDNLEEYSTCSNCGHVVPTANLMVHDANCRRTMEHAPLPPSRPPTERTQQLSQSATWQQTFGGQSSSTGMSSNNDNSGSTTSASHDNLEMTGIQNSPGTDYQSIELAEGQWQCQRCTLINEGRYSNCDACLSPRDGSSLPQRPPDATVHERLVPPQVDNGWVNVAYNPQFHRGQTNNSTVHGRNSGSVSQLTRIFNGLVNGAIIGSVIGGAGGMLVGGLAGAAGGAMVDRARQSEEENELRETTNVANMLANEGGGIEAGTVRIHRANGHLTALASVGQGQNRLIRVRYGPRLSSVQNAELQQRMMDGSMSDLELSLLETLVRMSYARGGTGLGNNIILQPEESFEELIQRFGLGTENRGASTEVIDSYPVEVVQRVTGVVMIQLIGLSLQRNNHTLITPQNQSSVLVVFASRTIGKEN